MSRLEEAEKATQTVVAGAIGNVLEWYDFALFGFFAPIIGTLASGPAACEGSAASTLRR